MRDRPGFEGTDGAPVPETPTTKGEGDDFPFRIIDLNNAASNTEHKHCSNVVVSAKYHPWWIFPFKNLAEQFSRGANVYFLLIAVLSCFSEISPVPWYTAVGPLALVLSVTMAKEIYEDTKRYASDREVNRRPTIIVDPTTRAHRSTSWSLVSVGDIIQVFHGEEFPADLLFLSSSDLSGVAYVSTSNLDGETNAKMKMALAETRGLATPGDLIGLRGRVACEVPNNHLYSYDGRMRLDGDDRWREEDVVADGANSMPSSSSSEAWTSLDIDNMLLRATTLKSSGWVYGLVVYTGRDTKIQMNSTPPPHKMSTLEKNSNYMVLCVFFLQQVFALFCSIANESWRGDESMRENRWYTQSYAWGGEGMLSTYLTMIILVNQLIPISLYISLEIVKVGQAVTMHLDSAMYCAQKGIYCVPKTSSLNEELGKIEYILSDKTGTLTQNKMVFAKASIHGKMYSNSAENIARCSSDINDPILMSKLRSARKGSDKGSPEDAEHLGQIMQFFEHLSLCHTVAVEEKEDGISYSANSPDEAALVAGAAYVGYKLCRRERGFIEIDNVLVGSGQRYEVLAVLEFSSERKRMSIIVRDPGGKIMLYCKGADNVIFGRLAVESGPAANDILDQTKSHVLDFSRMGLRTLCLAARELSEAEYDNWRNVYREACTSLDGREEKQAIAAELIETNLNLVGATAVDDKLQDGVPRTLAVLAKAGIKVWVLTGDKQETAISIGLSCKLLNERMELMIVNASSVQAVTEIIREHSGFLSRAMDRDLAPATEFALVVDGESLLYALTPELEVDFFEVARWCHAVICCRVSPLQKAQLTNLVKLHASAITLAIGDGANDVPMIKAAHVGVGISGNEGRQAVMAADFAIGQFRFLSHLILYHGRRCYINNKEVVFYAFYKNMAYVAVQFYFNFINGFTGQTFYPGILMATFNMFWASMPTLIQGIYNRDIESALVSEIAPQIYRETQKEKRLHVEFLWTLCVALSHSLIAWFTGYKALGGVGDNGQDLGLWSRGIFTYNLVLWVVNLRLALRTTRWTPLNHLFVWGTLGFWTLSVYGFSRAMRLPERYLPEMFGVMEHLWELPQFFIASVLGGSLCLLFEIVFWLVNREFGSGSQGILQEVDAGYFKGQHVGRDSSIALTKMENNTREVNLHPGNVNQDHVMTSFIIKHPGVVGGEGIYNRLGRHTKPTIGGSSLFEVSFRSMGQIELPQGIRIPMMGSKSFAGHSSSSPNRSVYSGDEGDIYANWTENQVRRRRQMAARAAASRSVALDPPNASLHPNSIHLDMGGGAGAVEGFPPLDAEGSVPFSGSRSAQDSELPLLNGRNDRNV